MTGPQVPGIPDFGTMNALQVAQYYMSPTQQNLELEQYLKMRQRMSEDMMQAQNKAAMGFGSMQNGQQPPGDIDLGYNPFNQNAGPQQQGTPVQPMRTRSQEIDRGTQLARAGTLGIMGAEAMPDEVLGQAIESQRKALRPTLSEFEHKLMPDSELLANASAFSVSAIGETAHMARQLASAIPHWGDVIERKLGEHTTENWMAALDEGIKANLPQEYQGRAELSGAIGKFAPAIAAWEGSMLGLAGLTGYGVGFLPAAAGKIAGSAIARGAIAGLGTSLLLDAGSDKPWLPSQLDLGKLVAGDLGPTIGDRLATGFNLTFGNRVMGGAINALFGATQLLAKDKLALKDSERMDDEGTAYIQARQQLALPPGPEVQPPAGDLPPGQYNMPGENPSAARVFTVDSDGQVQSEPKTFGPAQGPAIPTGPAQFPGSPEYPGLRTDVDPGMVSWGQSSPWFEGVKGPMSPVEFPEPAQQPIMDRSRLLTGPQRVSNSPWEENKFDSVDRRVREQEFQIEQMETNSFGKDTDEGFKSYLAQKKYSLAQLKEVQATQRFDRSNFLSTTTEEATPELIRLRGELIDAMNSSSTTDEQLMALQTQHDDLMFRSGTPRREEPTIWDVVRTNPLSPKTSMAQVAKHYGTTVLTPSGEPKMMVHGSGVGFEEIDPTMLNAPNLYAGPGFYVTENPVVAGGDPSQIITQPGYADNRAVDIAERRIGLQEQMQAAQDRQASMPPGYPGADGDQSLLSSLQQQLDALPVAAPNVRAVFIAAKNLFDFNGPMTMENGLRYLQAASEKHPGEWQKAASQWMSKFGDPLEREQLSYNYNNYGASPPQGKELWDLMVRTGLTGEDETASWHSIGGAGILGPQRTNELLADMGHEGIRYDGGFMAGAGSGMGGHEAMAIFHPRHVLSVFADEPYTATAAKSLGIQLTKSVDAVGSPLMPAKLGQNAFTEHDLAELMMASKPGGFHVIKGVTEPSMFGNGIYRPVMREGRLDALFSDHGPITDEAAEMYEKSGLMPGMEVVKSSGQSGHVVKLLDGDRVLVQTDKQRLAGIKGSPHKLSTLMPSNSSGSILEAPELYEQFKQFSMGTTQARVHSLGNYTYVPDWFDDQVYQRLPQLFDSFADGMGIPEGPQRAGIYRFFDRSRVAEASKVDHVPGDIGDIADGVMNDLASADELHEPDLQELAAIRGYRVIPNEGKPGFVVEDSLSDKKYLMNDQQAVEDFLRESSSERLPDATPSSAFPLEAYSPATDSAMHRVPDEDVLEDATIEDLSNAEWEYVNETGEASAFGGSANDAGGAGQPPQEPPSGSQGASSSGSGGRGGRRGGVNALRESIKKQFAKAPARVAQIQHYYTHNIAQRLLQPMRSVFQNVESDLMKAGVGDVKVWSLFDDIVSGMDKAHNATFDFHTRLADQMAFVDRQKLRDGSWMRMLELNDEVGRAMIGMQQGFKPAEIKAARMARKVLNDMMGPQTADNLFEWMGKARTSHAGGGYGPASYKADLYPDVQFFADHAKDVRMRFDSNDARTILRSVVRSYGFAEHAGPAWNEAQQLRKAIAGVVVDGRRPYTEMSNLLGDWLDFTQRGVQPGKDTAVKAVNYVMRKVGIPLTHAETRNLMQGMQGKMYEAMQGWRVHVMVRDSTQPLMAIPTVDLKHMASTYKDLLLETKAGYQEIVQRALDNGVAMHAMPRVEGTGMFEAQSLGEQANFSKRELWMRKQGLAIGDAVRNATPRGLRNVNLSKWGPLGLYTKEGELNRIIVGEAAYRKWNEAVGDWNRLRAAGVEGGKPVPGSGQLLSAANVDSFSPAFQRKVASLVDAGNLDEARAVYMRGVADRTQFTYGGRHAPAAVRTTGARMGYAFGSFSGQTIQLLRDLSKYGSAGHKRKMLATFAAVTGSLELLHRTTGWNFRSFEWWNIGFTGSPMMKGAVETWKTADAARDVIFSEDPSSESVQQIASVSTPRTLGNIIKMFNPGQGALYTAQGISGAMDSPNPFSSVPQFMTTGSSNARDAMDDALMPVGSQSTVQDAQPSRQMPPDQRLPGVNQHSGYQQAFIQLMQGNQNLGNALPQTPPPTPRSAGGGFF